MVPTAGLERMGATYLRSWVAGAACRASTVSQPGGERACGDTLERVRRVDADSILF